MTKRRREFGKEFKQEAVALVVEQGYSYAEAGRSLGIRGNLIGRWKRQLEVEQGDAFPGRGKLPKARNAMSYGNHGRTSRHTLCVRVPSVPPPSIEPKSVGPQRTASPVRPREADRSYQTHNSLI